MGESSTKEISVFVDESGSFEPDEESSRFYLVCLLLHDQGDDISGFVNNLESYLEAIGLGRDHAVHVGPLIRREGVYQGMLREERQAVFRKMMAFIRKINVSYGCFKIDKHFNQAPTAVHDKLLQGINRFLINHADMLNSYDKLKVYYDDGQSQVKALLHEAFGMFSARTEFVEDVRPEKYRLFQAADLLCSVELIAAKLNAGSPMTASEDRFFGSSRVFERDILRKLMVKKI